MVRSLRVIGECRRGHDRKDAYIYFHPFTGKRNVICRTCARRYYEQHKERLNGLRCEESFQRTLEKHMLKRTRVAAKECNLAISTFLIRMRGHGFTPKVRKIGKVMVRFWTQSQINKIKKQKKFSQGGHEWDDSDSL